MANSVDPSVDYDSTKNEMANSVDPSVDYDSAKTKWQIV